MAAGNNRGLLIALVGSPFALIGLIFLLKGKFGVGLAFLLLGLMTVGLGATSGRKADKADDNLGQQPSEVGDKPSR